MDSQSLDTILNGISILYWLSTKNVKYQVVEDVPVGLINGLTFSLDNKKLAMILNTSQTLDDSFILDIKRAATQYNDLTR